MRGVGEMRSCFTWLQTCRGTKTKVVRNIFVVYRVYGMYVLVWGEYGTSTSCYGRISGKFRTRSVLGL